MVGDSRTTIINAIQQVRPDLSVDAIDAALAHLFSGTPTTLGGNAVALTFGQGNIFDQATISIGAVAGGDITSVTVQLPQPLDPLAAAQAVVASIPRDTIPAPEGLPPRSFLPLGVLGDTRPLISRPDLLMAIAAGFQPSPTGGVPIIHLRGMAGIGKTTLAAAVVQHYGQHFLGGVFWLQAHDRETLQHAIVAAGLQMLGALPERPIPEQVAFVLACWQEAMPRLLVVDGCDDVDALTDLMPIIGGCRVLLTSQRQWDLPNQTVIDVPLLADAESHAILQRLVPGITAPEAADLAALLGHVPLALQIAAHYLAVVPMTVRDYAASLQQAVVDTLDQHVAAVHVTATRQGRALPRTVVPIGAVFARSLQQLAQDTLGLRILRHLAWFAPGVAVPLPLLAQSVGYAADPAWEDALILLANLGFLPSAAAPSLHLLLADVLRGQDSSGKAQRAVEDAVGQVLTKNLAEVIDIVPHIRAVAARVTHHADFRTTALAQQLAPLFRELGDPVTAIALYHWVLQTMPNIPVERADVLYQMGITYPEGAADQAIVVLEQALALHRQYVGTDHLFVAADEIALARRFIATERFRDAETLFTHALAVYQDRLPRFDQRVIDGYDLLLSLLQTTEQMSTHAAVMHEMLATQKCAINKAQGGDLLTLWRLGDYYYRRGVYTQAGLFFQRALIICEQVRGANHFDMAFNLNKLAQVLEATGEYTQAESLFRRALAILEKIFGPDHPDTATTLHNLAHVLYVAGDYAQAGPLLRRALTIQESALGANHPDTIASLSSLAQMLFFTGDYTQAELLYRRVLVIREHVEGAGHHTAMSLHDLAQVLEATKDYVQAEHLFRRALMIEERVLGPEHPQTIVALNNLGRLLLTTKDYAQAEQLFLRALMIDERVLGSEHPHIANILNNLATLLCATGNDTQAEPLYRRALAIRERVLGPAHPNTQHIRDYLAALSRNNLAE